jgi:gamma-glutamylcyclotransferase
LSDQTKLFYFAYGSNMFTERLKKRCRTATPLTVAFADNCRLTFWKRSKDGSGKGHLVRDANISQPGVLFSIDSSDLHRLDQAEGKGNGYERDDSFVVRRADTGEVVNSITYLISEIDENLLPYDWYLALIVHGAREHGLGQELIGRLLATERLPDPKADSPSRGEAIGLLTKAGTDVSRTLDNVR